MNILVWFVIALVATLAFWNLWAAVIVTATFLAALGVWGLWCLSARSQNPESRSQCAESGRSGVPAATGVPTCGVADVAHATTVAHATHAPCKPDMHDVINNALRSDFHLATHPVTAPAPCRLDIKPAPHKKAGYNKSKKRKHR